MPFTKATSPAAPATIKKEPIDRRVGDFSARNTGVYNIKQRCYPLEISTDVDRQHYVTFFINVRGKSKFKANNPNKIIGEVSNGKENRTNTNDLSKATGIAMGAAAGAVMSLGLGKTVTKAVYARNSRAGGGVLGSATKGGLAGAAVVGGAVVAGGAAGAMASDFVIQPDTAYRISDAITLHVQNAPQAQYSAQYDNVELGTLIGGVASGISATEAMRYAMLPEAARAVLLKAGSGIGNVLSAGQIGNAVGVASKQNLNPFREVLFQATGFRQFAFDYTFMPKNQQEVDNVQQIIKTFKYHMHPELSAGGLYYIHPSEFNIQYYFNGKENKYLNKISTCVLMDMQVDYGGEAFSTFRDGSPVEIKMRLMFREVETLTKERVEEGF